jgi:hypothetical protein
VVGVVVLSFGRVFEGAVRCLKLVGGVSLGGAGCQVGQTYQLELGRCLGLLRFLSGCLVMARRL